MGGGTRGTVSCKLTIRIAFSFLRLIRVFGPNQEQMRSPWAGILTAVYGNAPLPMRQRCASDLATTTWIPVLLHIL
jgi:hypothetical protein